MDSYVCTNDIKPIEITKLSKDKPISKGKTYLDSQSTKTIKEFQFQRMTFNGSKEVSSNESPSDRNDVDSSPKKVETFSKSIENNREDPTQKITPSLLKSRLEVLSIESRKKDLQNTISKSRSKQSLSKVKITHEITENNQIDDELINLKKSSEENSIGNSKSNEIEPNSNLSLPAEEEEVGLTRTNPQKNYTLFISQNEIDSTLTFLHPLICKKILNNKQRLSLALQWKQINRQQSLTDSLIRSNECITKSIMFRPNHPFLLKILSSKLCLPLPKNQPEFQKVEIDKEIYKINDLWINAMIVESELSKFLPKIENFNLFVHSEKSIDGCSIVTKDGRGVLLVDAETKLERILKFLLRTKSANACVLALGEELKTNLHFYNQVVLIRNLVERYYQKNDVKCKMSAVFFSKSLVTSSTIWQITRGKNNYAMIPDVKFLKLMAIWKGKKTLFDFPTKIYFANLYYNKKIYFFKEMFW